MNNAEERDATGHSAPDTGTAETSRETPWYIEIPLVLVITLVFIFAIRTFIGGVFVIPSRSMEPTLHGCQGCTGDRIAVEKLSYAFSDPQPGDIIVFEGPESWAISADLRNTSMTLGERLHALESKIGLTSGSKNYLVKRIIATGGHTVSCQEGDPAVMVDGRPIDQSYVADPPARPHGEAMGSHACGGPHFGPVTVPEGNVWVMGDNRTASADSRAHMGNNLNGTIPEDMIEGKVRWIIFPFSRMGAVHSVDLLANVP